MQRNINKYIERNLCVKLDNFQEEIEDSCKRTEKIFADRIVRSKGQLTAPYHKKARLEMLQRVSTLHCSIAGAWNGTGASFGTLEAGSLRKSDS